jgi:hypothetical protein
VVGSVVGVVVGEREGFVIGSDVGVVVGEREGFVVGSVVDVGAEDSRPTRSLTGKYPAKTFNNEYKSNKSITNTEIKNYLHQASGYDQGRAASKALASSSSRSSA